MIKPCLRTVRELSPAEWLPILRADLVVARGYVHEARREGRRLPAYEARVSELEAGIRELEAMSGTVLAANSDGVDTDGLAAHSNAEV